MKLTKIAAVTLSAALIFGCDDLEFKETTSSDDSGSETETETDTGSTEANLFAAITDTSEDTSGNLRYTLADDDQSDLTTGALSVDVLYPSGQDQDFSIGLYDDSGSTSNMVADIILKSDGRVQTRVAGSGTTLSGVTHSIGTETNFTVTWDATTATYTAYMDDVEIFSGDFNNTAATAVASFGVKLASNAKVAAETSTVDNIKIYSDIDMTTVIFEDDFEEFVIGDDLAGGAAVYYSGEEAVVGGVEASDETDATDSDSDSTQVAAIADTDIEDTGELRYKLSDTLATGQVNVSILYDAEEDLSAYVTVFSDGGTSTSNQIADLKLDDGKISLRNIEGTLTTFTPGEWVDVQINWVTDGTGEADVTFSIDDTQIGDTYSITYDTDEEATFVGTGAEVVSVRYVDNSGTTVYTLYADDLSITDGTSEVFSDDFEGFDINEVLDGTDDDYNNNSSEATVAAQPE